MFNAVFFVALCLIIWCRTEAFVEYCNLFGVNEPFRIKEYTQVKGDDPSINYPGFLLGFYNNFFTRLLACPICMAVWLGAFTSLFVSIWAMPMISLLGLIVYIITDKILDHA